MKRLFVLLILALIVSSIGTSSLAFADSNSIDVIDTIRVDFSQTESDVNLTDITVGGDYQLDGKLTLSSSQNAGYIQTSKTAYSFLAYVYFVGEDIVITLGDSTLTVNYTAQKITFDSEEQFFDRTIKTSNESVLRVEVINGRLMVGVKSFGEARDMIHYNVADFSYAPNYSKITLKANNSDLTVNSLFIAPFDSNYKAEQHDYDPIEDAVPERTKKPVLQNGINPIVIVLSIVGGVVVLGAGVVIMLILLKKNKLSKETVENKDDKDEVKK